MILFGVLALSLLAAVALDAKLRIDIARSAQVFPPLSSSPLQATPTTSVVIPVYNEAENLEECLTAALQSELPAAILEVWVVDDQSTDDTWAIAQFLQQRLNDPRLKLLAGKPQPAGETWVGKSWACVQAAEQVKGEYLLFIDADVRLKPKAIETAVATAVHYQTDLLSCGVAVLCGCLAEWLVQPLIITVISIGFDFEAVNDPANLEEAFAAGPFMLFRRSAYAAIGGHRAVAQEVVEDVALGRLIKRQGFQLRVVPGLDLAAVRMYRSGSALWEGWTKNLYLGAERNLVEVLGLAGMMLLVCTAPWVGLIVLLSQAVGTGWNVWDGGTIALALSTIALHYDLRRLCEKISTIPPRYWWLTGVGGAVVATIAIASIIKTETGWGWTWRGRSLKQS